MISLSKTRWSRVARYVWPLALLVACGGDFFRPKNSMPSAPAASATIGGSYYPDTLAPFSRVTRHPSDHPSNMYSAEYAGGVLQSHLVEIHGTIDVTDQLELASGVIRGRRFLIHPGADGRDFVLAPPDRGGDYFRYLEELNNMMTALVALDLHAPSAFVREAQQRIRLLPNIAALHLLVWRDYEVLGTSTPLKLAYKTPVDGDLIVAFCDKTACYTRQRVVLPDHEGTLTLNMELPLEVKDMDSARFAVTLVPQGADESKKLAETGEVVQVESYENVHCAVGYQSRAGVVDTAFLAYRTHATGAWIEMKIFDSNGKLIADSGGVAAPPQGSEQSVVAVPYTIQSGTPPGPARVMVRLLPPPGDWSHFLAECATGIAVAP